MSECTCHKNYTLDTLIPKVGVITDIRQETPDVKTFRVNAPEGGKLFEHMPGQCAMVCATTTAYTGEHSVIVYRIVNKLMHESLTEKSSKLLKIREVKNNERMYLP